MEHLWRLAFEGTEKITVVHSPEVDSQVSGTIHSRGSLAAREK